VLEEFSKLKNTGKNHDTSWARQGWAALPDSIIDAILHCALGEHALISLQ
jgi:hypothetical protein